jgi:hypothetical protein
MIGAIIGDMVCMPFERSPVVTPRPASPARSLRRSTVACQCLYAMKRCVDWMPICSRCFGASGRAIQRQIPTGGDESSQASLAQIGGRYLGP